MNLIPIPKDKPFFARRVTLDGDDYQIRFEWNMRAGWFVALADADGVPIFAAKRIVPGWDLLRGSSDARRPRGGLYVVDSVGTNAQPGFTDLGTRHDVVYITEAELAALRA